MTFESAVEFILKFEGGYVNNPQDAGGETNFGISKRAYPDLDIAALSREDAIVIYKRDYWDSCRCGELPNGLDFMVFDMAVNQGTNAAIINLQRSLGIKVDGQIGPQTIEAAKKYVDSTGAAGSTLEFAARRMLKYAQNPQVNLFGLGWFRRLAEAMGIANKTA